DMDAATRSLIEAIHRGPAACVLAFTGGGTSAAGALLNVPGGSRSVLEVLVPYHEQALVPLLGRRPAPYWSAETSPAMAAQARDRWLPPGAAVLGLGCTASLATDRPKRGDHRFHVTADAGGRRTTYSLILAKGSRDREGEEAVLDAVILNALAEALGVSERIAGPLPDDTR